MSSSTKPKMVRIWYDGGAEMDEKNCTPHELSRNLLASLRVGKWGSEEECLEGWR